jgi:chemotaxis protein methyltransferase CheR
VVPELRAAKSLPRLRIWSAACSTGQEPFSIAMSLEEANLMQDDWEVDILATDISDLALEQARAGRYNQIEISRGMPVTLLLKYFQQEGHSWCIKPEFRTRVRYQKLNLLESEAPVGRFDIIFCRNVGIYFSDDGKAKMMRRLLASLAINGKLFLGTSESGFRYSDELEPIRYDNVIIYQRKQK